MLDPPGGPKGWQRARGAAAGGSPVPRGGFACPDVLVRRAVRRARDVPKARLLRRAGHVRRLGELFLRGEVLPEVGDAEGTVGTFECPFQTLYLIKVSGNNVGTKLGQPSRLLRVDVSR
jgi:hypothetical protein